MVRIKLVNVYKILKLYISVKYNRYFLNFYDIKSCRGVEEEVLCNILFLISSRRGV